MHILAHCFDPGTVSLFAATVDHGLRPEAKQEIQKVSQQAEDLGVSHTTLRWTGWDETGNLQEQARKARYQLLSDWAKTQDLAVVAVGHTADDQAETLLMRLARSSGVDGLASMPVRRTLYGVNVVRPLLGLTRAELQEYLKEIGLGWSQDPSNDDPKFDRIKIRQALQHLEPLGLTVKALSDVARNLEQAREALDWYCFLAARDIASVDGGSVVFDLRQFRTLPEEISRRLLVRAIKWIGGAEYPPRRLPAARALANVRLGLSVTLGGCQILRQGQKIWVCREYNAVRNKHVAVDEMWDRRWRLTGEVHPGTELRALGRAGLKECPDWRETGRPRAALLASPSLWAGNVLLAAPLAGRAHADRIELVGGEEEFFASLLSH